MQAIAKTQGRGKWISNGCPQGVPSRSLAVHTRRHVCKPSPHTYKYVEDLAEIVQSSCGPLALVKIVKQDHQFFLHVELVDKRTYTKRQQESFRNVHNFLINWHLEDLVIDKMETSTLLSKANPFIEFPLRISHFTVDSSNSMMSC